jgi:hypothetical protein
MSMKNWTAAVIFVAATCFVGMDKRVEGQLRWPEAPSKTHMRVRLVAVALADPRSSFFSSHEVFVAETEIGHEEWSLIKLVYTFLPYQPRLSDSGLDYSVVHEFSAWRESDCDETLAQLTARDWPNRHYEPLIYARDAPRLDLDRRRIPLPCFETNTDDYRKSSREPITPPEHHEDIPVLKERTKRK